MAGGVLRLARRAAGGGTASQPWSELVKDARWPGAHAFRQGWDAADRAYDPSVTETAAASCVYVFGPFRLDPARRTLHRDGAPVVLSGRTFDLLLALAGNAESVVDRQTLMHAVWGTRVVEEANLKQTVYELRKALEAGHDARLIVTVPMRGYQLALPARREPAHAEAPLRGTAGAARIRVGALAGAGFAAFALAAAFAWRAAPPAAPGSPGAAHAVAVLPFANASGDAGQNDLADGITDDLINDLGQIPGLRVAARTSSFLFRDHGRGVTEVARDLHVGVVLEGSVRRTGAATRINAALIDAASGFAVWSRGYDVGSADLLAAEAAIARDVAGAMQVAGAAEEAGPGAGGTGIAAAYDAYLRGMKLARGANDVPALTAALAAFEEAIARDPNFALARAYRARQLVLVAEDSTSMQAAEIHAQLDEALAEARRALAIAPRLGVAHMALADLYEVAQNFAEAQREMALARAAAPSDVQILIDSVFLDATLGQAARAQGWAALAVSLDPLAPSAYTALAYADRALRDFAGAAAALHRARLLGADADIDVMEALVALERGDDAAAEAGCARGKHWMNYLCLAIVEHRLGRTDEALFHLAALRGALGANGAFQYAEVYAQWKQPGEAVKWLQAAYRMHDAGLLSMRADPLLDPIRSTPQYATIVRKLNFPP